MATAQDDDSPQASTPPGANFRMASTHQIAALGIGLLVLGLLLAYLLASVWPPDAGSLKAAAAPTGIRLIGFAGDAFQVTGDVRMLMVVMVSGGLGSFIHTATSFSDFVGNEKLTRSWIWWYMLKPFIGMALAVVLYVAVRGGFMSGNSDAGNLNLYGIVALAGMSGMFSKQATDKLSEVFSSMFRTAPGGGDAKRKDDLSNLAPSLSALDPDTLAVGAQGLNLVVKGANFVRSSVVRVNGTNRPTVFKDETQLGVTLAAEDVDDERELAVTVINPPPGGGESATLSVRVAAVVAAAVAAVAEAAAETAAAAAAVAAGTATEGGGMTPLAEPDDQHADGCDVQILDALPDEQLPAARGGVSAP